MVFKRLDRGVSSAKNKVGQVITESWESEAILAFFLMVLVVTVFVLPAIGFGDRNERLYGDISFAVIGVSGVLVAWRSRWWRIKLSVVLLAALVLRAVTWRMPTVQIMLLNEGMQVATILLLAIALLREVFRAGPVTGMRIQGAIAVYLLFGIGFAHAYQIVSLIKEDAFRTSSGTLSSARDWIYYSFVTLTTVGYGDIIPVHQIARSLSIAESLSGQLYLSGLFARLVAMQIVSWQATRENGD